MDVLKVFPNSRRLAGYRKEFLLTLLRTQQPQLWQLGDAWSPLCLPHRERSLSKHMPRAVSAGYNQFTMCSTDPDTNPQMVECYLNHSYPVLHSGGGVRLGPGSRTSPVTCHRLSAPATFAVRMLSGTSINPPTGPQVLAKRMEISGSVTCARTWHVGINRPELWQRFSHGRASLVSKNPPALWNEAFFVDQ